MESMIYYLFKSYHIIWPYMSTWTFRRWSIYAWNGKGNFCYDIISQWAKRKRDRYFLCCLYLFFNFASCGSYQIPVCSPQRVCPENCGKCGRTLNKPYRLPCGHYIGECCITALMTSCLTEGKAQCPMTKCDTEILEHDPDYYLDMSALDNRYIAL